MLIVFQIFMTDQIVLKQLIRFVAMSSTATELGNIGMKSVVKAAGTIVETNENNVRRLICPFSQGRSDKNGFEHAEVLMIKQMKRFLRKDPPRMSESSIHLVVLIIHNSKKHSHGSVCKNCVDEIGIFLDANKFVKDKTRVDYPVSPDRKNNSLHVTPVTTVKHVWDDIIEKWPIDKSHSSQARLMRVALTQKALLPHLLKSCLNNVNCFSNVKLVFIL